MVKKNFEGKKFPTKYYFGGESSPRLTTTPPHTIRDGTKEFRNEALPRFAKHAGIILYDVDLSCCHVRAIMMFTHQKDAPLLYKSMIEKNLYLDIAN